MTAVIAIIQALVAGVPRIVELIQNGTKPEDIKLGDFISRDALADLEAAKDEADDFVKNG